VLKLYGLKCLFAGNLMSSVEWVRNWPDFKIGPLTNGTAPSKKQLRQHSLKTIGLEMLIEKNKWAQNANI
jgi:hypothetical protein